MSQIGVIPTHVVFEQFLRRPFSYACDVAGVSKENVEVMVKEMSDTSWVHLYAFYFAQSWVQARDTGTIYPTPPLGQDMT